jgi:NAD(P)-dependent dehydrogenase (short-subunit alcohol dehydrogenase family)
MTIEELAVAHLGLPRDVLAGKVAIVTGAGRGIGREIARAFAWLGARVVIAEISDQGLETECLVKEAGGEALFVKTDISIPEEVDRLGHETHLAFGPVDVLINNAILCPAASVLEMDVALWDRVMAVNLRGTFLTCKAFLPEMLARENGTIVNMISTDAMPNLSAYMASKQGILAFSQSLAGEVGERGVRVIPFAPGFVDTPGLRDAAQRLSVHFGLSEEQFMSMPIHPAYTGRAMPADHAAAAAAYLVATLADEYHGEAVNGYTVLERAGVIQATPVEPQPETGTIPAAQGDGREASLEELLLQAISHCEQLLAILAETAGEFDRLPLFVRPMARAGFKSKSGLSLQDWTHTVHALAGRLEELKTAGPPTRIAPPPAYPIPKELLEKLIRYYHEVPAETARFTKDETLLTQIKLVSIGRVNIIRGLMDHLDAYFIESRE